MILQGFSIVIARRSVLIVLFLVRSVVLLIVPSVLPDFVWLDNGMGAGWVDEIAWCEASWSSKLSLWASHTMVLLLLGMMMLSLLMMLMLLNMLAASLVHLLGLMSLALVVTTSVSSVLLD